FNRFGDIVGIFFKAEFRSMDADNYETEVFLRVIPPGDVGQGADAVDAGACPEIYEHHFAFQVGDSERRAVEPVRDAREIRSAAIILKIRRCYRRSICMHSAFVDIPPGGGDTGDDKNGK